MARISNKCNSSLSLLSFCRLCIHGLLSAEDAEAYLADIGKGIK